MEDVKMNLLKKRVDEKSLRKFSALDFENWVILRFNGKTADPASGVNAFTEGGQPLLIMQSDQVSLVDVEGFVKVLVKGRAQKGAIVAFNYDNDAIEGKITAMDNGIDLQLLRVSELVNKNYANRIKALATDPVTFEASTTQTIQEPMSLPKTETFQRMPPELLATQGSGKPRVFISNSNTQVASQVKKMLEFLHYDYYMGNKEETNVPISENQFGLMQDCDCAIVTIAAAEQERRYSGLYLLNSSVVSDINAAYLKYNTQVVLLVERKVELPPNLRGLKQIQYDRDDLSFNAAMDLKTMLADFKRIN
jgi:predicted nucleotide-binding protein